MNLPALPIIDRVLRILLHDACLHLVEPGARRVSPPLLELAVLVVEPAGGVERVLEKTRTNERRETT